MTRRRRRRRRPHRSRSLSPVSEFRTGEFRTSFAGSRFRSVGARESRTLRTKNYHELREHWRRLHG